MSLYSPTSLYILHPYISHCRAALVWLRETRAGLNRQTGDCRMPLVANLQFKSPLPILATGWENTACKFNTVRSLTYAGVHCIPCKKGLGSALDQRLKGEKGLGQALAQGRKGTTASTSSTIQGKKGTRTSTNSMTQGRKGTRASTSSWTQGRKEIRASTSSWTQGGKD